LTGHVHDDFWKYQIHVSQAVAIMTVICVHTSLSALLPPLVLCYLLLKNAVEHLLLDQRSF